MSDFFDPALESFTSNKRNVSAIVNEHSIQLFASGEWWSVPDDHHLFADLKVAVENENWTAAERLAKATRDVLVKFSKDGLLYDNGMITYQGEPISNGLTDRILGMAKQGLDASAMVLFLENLLDNPTKSAIDELFLFMEHCTLPITDDGHFLAYKKLRGDFRDVYSGRFDNSPGNNIEMPREHVDSERNRTCSTGLHFCSKSYLNQFGSSIPGDYKVVLLKINPRDVVSIPVDYNFAKGRTCRYHVLMDVTDQFLPDDLYVAAVNDLLYSSYVPLNTNNADVDSDLTHTPSESSFEDDVNAARAKQAARLTPDELARVLRERLGLVQQSTSDQDYND